MTVSRRNPAERQRPRRMQGAKLLERSAVQAQAARLLHAAALGLRQSLEAAAARQGGAWEEQGGGTILASWGAAPAATDPGQPQRASAAGQGLPHARRAPGPARLAASRRVVLQPARGRVSSGAAALRAFGSVRSVPRRARAVTIPPAGFAHLSAAAARVQALAGRVQQQVTAAAARGCAALAEVAAPPPLRCDDEVSRPLAPGLLRASAQGALADKRKAAHEGAANARERERAASLLGVGLEGGGSSAWRAAADGLGDEQALGDVSSCEAQSTASTRACSKCAVSLQAACNQLEGSAAEQASGCALPTPDPAGLALRCLLGAQGRLQAVLLQLGGMQAGGGMRCRVFDNPCYSGMPDHTACMHGAHHVR